MDGARLESLARDPANEWKVDDGLIEEARIAVRLEHEGYLQGVVRSPTPEADFIEDGGAGQSWDIKSYRSNGLDFNKAELDINGELTKGNHVIVNTAHLTRGQVAEFQRVVQLHSWEGRGVFASSE